MQKSRYDLVIFDCDGVIVDSEMMSADCMMQIMAEDGMPISFKDFRETFLGRSFQSCAVNVEKRFGKPLADDFLARYKSRLFALMKEGLQPIRGIDAVLSDLNCPFCLASSSSLERIKISLEAAGVWPHFEGRVFSAEQVVHGKPAPDLFLFAAQQMGVAAEHSLVIEDSEMGVRAARAAGCHVWHFQGGSHMNGEGWLPPDVTADREVKDTGELRQFFTEVGLCRV